MAVGIYTAVGAITWPVVDGGADTLPGGTDAAIDGTLRGRPPA